jgi:putative ABC transport system ATP-binding protein
MISIESLNRHYQLGGSQVRAVDGVDFSLENGEFLAVLGASGSGKTTLLNLIGGLDRPTSGEIITEHGALTNMNSKSLAKYRADYVGMVFQSFNLIHHRTALSNVELALFFNSESNRDRRGKAKEMLIRLGLGDRIDHKPDDLSGGEQQRVAIARALVKNPKLLLADEPTGNLDRENSEIICDVISEWNRKGGTVIFVTHNRDLAENYAHRILRMDYGKIVEERSVGGQK